MSVLGHLELPLLRATLFGKSLEGIGFCRNSSIRSQSSANPKGTSILSTGARLKTHKMWLQQMPSCFQSKSRTTCENKGMQVELIAYCCAQENNVYTVYIYMRRHLFGTKLKYTMYYVGPYLV